MRPNIPPTTGTLPPATHEVLQPAWPMSRSCHPPSQRLGSFSGLCQESNYKETKRKQGDRAMHEIHDAQ